MPKTAEIKVNWEEVNKLVVVSERTEDSKAGAKRPYKKGDKVEKVVIKDIDSAMKVFGGEKAGLLRVLSRAMTTMYDLRKADPDAAYNVPARRLLDADFFVPFGLKKAGTDATKDEIRQAVTLFKSIKENASSLKK